jgi:hypothetical protein
MAAANGAHPGEAGVVLSRASAEASFEVTLTIERG